MPSRPTGASLPTGLRHPTEVGVRQRAHIQRASKAMPSADHEPLKSALRLVVTRPPELIAARGIRPVPAPDADQAPDAPATRTKRLGQTRCTTVPALCEDCAGSLAACRNSRSIRVC